MQGMVLMTTFPGLGAFTVGCPECGTHFACDCGACVPFAYQAGIGKADAQLLIDLFADLNPAALD